MKQNDSIGIKDFYLNWKNIKDTLSIITHTSHKPYRSEVKIGGGSSENGVDYSFFYFPLLVNNQKP